MKLLALLLLLPLIAALGVVWLLGWFMPGMRVLPARFYGRKRQ